MKSLKLLWFVLLFNSISLLAQQIPFQGKLLENGQPVTDSKTFNFSIQTLPINWSETHLSVPIVNGLYSVVLGSIIQLPDTLFEVQSSYELYISVDSTPLDTVEIFAPIEVDPTVPVNLKDGVVWSEIGDIPTGITDDIDSTNEIQSLSYLAGTLSISKGNSVDILTTDSLLLLENFQVGVSDTNSIADPEQILADTYTLEDTVWQSFTVNESGELTEIWIEFANSLITDVKLKLFEGTGASGQSIFDESFPASNFTSTIQYQTFAINPVIPINFNSGQTYTFQLIGISNPLLVSSIGNDQYPFGISSIGSDIDLKFSIFMEVVTPIKFVITSDGNVGIGTSSPNARLEIVAHESTSEENTFLVSSAMEETLFKVTNNGKVGIGTDSPISTFDINGNANISGDLYIGGSLLPTTLTTTNYQFFTTDGTFTAPDGVTMVFITMIGGGGGGGGQGPGGGGSCSIIKYPYSVIPGIDYSIIVGNAGEGGITSVGTDGGNSSFDIMTVYGGNGAGNSVPGNGCGTSMKAYPI